MRKEGETHKNLLREEQYLSEKCIFTVGHSYSIRIYGGRPGHLPSKYAPES